MPFVGGNLQQLEIVTIKVYKKDTLKWFPDKSGPEKAFVNTVDRVLKLVLLLLSFPLFTTIII